MKERTQKLLDQIANNHDWIGPLFPQVNQVTKPSMNIVEVPLRFVPSSLYGELINLYHLARTALSGQDDSKYARMCWACREFHKAHPEISQSGAYKDLSAKLEGY